MVGEWIPQMKAVPDESKSHFRIFVDGVELEGMISQSVKADGRGAPAIITISVYCEIIPEPPILAETD